MSYTASVLLAPGSHVSLQDAELKLLNFFRKKTTQPTVSTQHRENKLVLTFGDWSLYIYLNSEPHVLRESQEMAELFGKNHPHKAIIATCDSRFEISCDPDKSMDHFNNYILTLEQLSSISGVFVFEDASQEFM
jgi:hypothetical protein